MRPLATRAIYLLLVILLTTIAGFSVFAYRNSFCYKPPYSNKLL